MSRTRRITLRLLLSAGIFLIGCVLAELGYRAVRALRGKPYDAAALVHEVQEAARLSIGASTPAAPLPANASGTILQPYFGGETVQDQGGLLSYFRAERKAPTLSVLVLGGSVAFFFSDALRPTVNAKLSGDTRLGHHYFRLLNGAHYAYKQPQQLEKLAYLLSEGAQPDAVIELDGFNELALAMNNWEDHYDPLYPFLPIWGEPASAVESLTPQTRARISEAWLLRQETEHLGALAEHWSWSSLVGTWILGRTARANARLHELEEQHARAPELDRDSHMWRQVHGPEGPKERGAALELCLRAWEESSLSMDALCRARGIVYLHVLQPTLWDTGSKPLTPHEQELFARENVWKQPTATGYPELRKRGERLRQRGVEFLDASLAFADAHEELYYDHCHFVDAGSQRLWALIEPKLVELLQQSLAQRPR